MNCNQEGPNEDGPVSIGFSLANMDQSADPREDFYQYAVGGWLRSNPVPPDKSRWGSFNELYDRNLILLKSILEEATEDASAPEGSTKQLIGDFYKSAMDTKRIGGIRFEPVIPVLLGVSQVEHGVELSRLLGEMRNSGIPGLFSSHSAADKRNSEFYAFYLDQGGLSLPDREYYISDAFRQLRESYTAHIERMFFLSGETDTESRRFAEIVLRIETELATASRSRTELRDQEKNYNKMQVSDFDQLYPSLHVRAFLDVASVAGSDELIVGQPEFFSRLEALLSNEPVENIRVLLRWKVLHAFAPYLHPEVEEEDFKFFHKQLLGQKEPEARWKRATAVIDQLLGEALGAVYVEKYFPPEAKKRASQMIDDIREVFRDRLANLPWMTESTRKQALEKFARFKAKIGHPDKFRDYSSVRIDPDDLVGNIIRSSEFEALRQARRVGQKVDREEWRMSPPTVNAYFQPMENTINFPAGILQPPFFDMAQDDAVNYGGIGVVIGHEITHGYDDQGRKFDAMGNLHDWWTKEDAEGFQKRAKEVVDLYSAQEPLPGMHVNGELTLGENIADFGGVSLAYEALQRRLSSEPSKRKSIDGLTPEQRLFLSFGQIWKENIREEEIRRRLTVDPHALGKYRATLPAINHPGFDTAFPHSNGEDGRTRKVAVW